MMSQVPVECKRTKSISTDNSFIPSLRHFFCNGRGEHLPDGSFFPLYIGQNDIELLHSNTNSIIWGRRGTGKTHLLKAFCQKVNDSKDRELAFFVSCDGIKTETPVTINFPDDEQKMKYYSRETFVSFLTFLIDDISKSYRAYLDNKVFINNVKSERLKKIDRIEDTLIELFLLATEGVPHIITMNGKETSSYSKRFAKRRKHGFTSNFSSPKEFLGNLFTFNNESDKDENELTQTDVEMKYTLSFSSIKECLRKLVKYMEIDMLYICIDELWLIDSKREHSLQPMFLDFIRQTFMNQQQISIKIASIRETTKINSKCSMGNSYGLQSGEDIYEILNLDTMDLPIKDIQDNFLSLLTTRIGYFANQTYHNQYILESIFNNKRYFELMVAVSHGIPRNFLEMITQCLYRINFDINSCFLHMYLISDVSIRIFNDAKRSNLPLNSNSIYSKVKNYVIEKKCNFFILSNEHVKRVEAELNNLIYIEIIHRIPSSLTPLNIMDDFKALFVDSGNYLYISKEMNDGNFDKTLAEYSLLIPKDIGTNFESYIIDLDHIQSEFVECPNCSTVISKSHPVYAKHSICNVCGIVLKKR